MDASLARKFVVEDRYHRLDVMAGYATRVFQRRVKFQINVDNITDEFYADKSLGDDDVLSALIRHKSPPRP